ncbi:hypothetical protein PPYR_10316 [Photinus pyralis]|uniref:Uncharacterized protein n=1 Tax=Photinus pyralis TaxID=7054 RepID=A0A5N4AFZ8_PHOPY|nr:hypothetical protein PPYR_10316 [Photinus pyralis]
MERIQRKFLKYLSFKVNGVYPERGCCQNALLAKFNMEDLDKRRTRTSVTFLFKIIHQLIDCACLLQELQFHVPHFSSRSSSTFYHTTPNSNILINSPIYNMCSVFNSICDKCDIHNSHMKDILDIF